MVKYTPADGCHLLDGEKMSMLFDFTELAYTKEMYINVNNGVINLHQSVLTFAKKNNMYIFPPG